ncbi:MAG: hypothetical protein RL616_1140 [Verrucomicrobiota bacterium]
MKKTPARFIRRIADTLLLAMLFSLVGISAQAALKVSTSTGGTWNVGTSWVGGVAPVAASDTVQIVSGANITNSSATSILGIVVDSGGTLTVSSTLTCNHGSNPTADWLVNGAVNNTGGANTVALGANATMIITNGGFYTNASSGSGTANIGAGASITFTPGSTYVNNKNGGTVPTCTFQPGSKAVFIGNTSSGPAVQTAGQTFGTVIWNCSQSAAIGNAGVFDTTILGDFIIANTGGQEMRLGSTQTGSVNISGNLIVTNGILNLSSSSGAQTVNVTNNVIVASGGTITVTTAGKGIIALQKVGGIPFTMTGTIGSGVKTIIPSTSSLTVSNTQTHGIVDVNGFMNLNGQALTLNALTNDVANVGYITNSGAAITLTIGIGNYSSSFSGKIAQGANAISLVKGGTGAQILGGVNTYTGNTTVNGGTLTLGQPTLATNSTVTITNNAILQLGFTGTNTVASLVTNGITAGAGVYNANNSSPFIGGTGSLLIPNSQTNGSAEAAGGGFTVNSVDGHILTVRFHQAVSSTGSSATTINNYTAYGKAIGPITITNATLLDDNQSVALYLDSVAGEFFAVGVSNVLDFDGSNIVGNATGYLTSFVSTRIGTSGDPSSAGEAIKIGGGSYQIAANGSDIGGTDDHCHFVYDTITGDFETIANVTRLDFTDNDAKVCLMARESTATGSRSVAIGFTPLVPGIGTNRVVMLMRTNNNGDTFDFGDSPQLNSLGWLRMTRTGNFFATFYATNGIDWIQCGSFTNVFATNLLIGLATTSHTNGQMTTAGATSFGIAGKRLGSDVVPTLSFSFVANNIIAKWQRTPRDYTVQVTDRLASGSPSVSSNLPAGAWAYVMLPVFDTSLTGTNSLMTTNGRYMSIPINMFSNNQMFVRLTQVEKVIPDPLGVTAGMVISQSAGNTYATNNGAYALGSFTVATNTALYAMEIKTNAAVNPNTYTTNTTYVLTPSSSTNYTFTTEDTDNTVHTIMQLRKYVSGTPQFTGVTNTFGQKTSGHAQVSVVGGANVGYSFIIASTNNPTSQTGIVMPTACNPILLKINMTGP